MAVIEYDSYKQKLLALKEEFENLEKALDIEMRELEAQLAEKLNISRQHLGAIEAPNIVRVISMDLLFNIATVLQIEPSKLLEFRNK